MQHFDVARVVRGLRVGHQLAAAVAQCDQLDGCARLCRDVPVDVDDRRFAQRVNRPQLGRRQADRLARVKHDLVIDAQLLEQPKNSLRARVVQVVDGDQGPTLIGANLEYYGNVDDPDVLAVDRWSLRLAPGWRAELEDGCACMTGPDELGVLLISFARKARAPVAREELIQLASAELPASADTGSCRMGDFDGLHATYVEGGQRWQRFYLCFGTLLLLVTYTVDLDHDGSEDDAVIGMLRTLHAQGDRWE